MIVDSLEHAARYAALGPNITLALDALRHTDLARREPGRYDLKPDGSVFALVQDYETKSREGGIWEAHRRYIDVQFVAEGVEVMGYANLAALSPRQPYDVEKDFALFDGPGDFLTVSAGGFAVFFPHDAHIPGLAVGDNPLPVRKVVVKVEAECWAAITRDGHVV